ncbi:hypothetical protein VTI74DRAFT_8304 [Chaetomium olivicolor]
MTSILRGGNTVDHLRCCGVAAVCNSGGQYQVQEEDASCLAPSMIMTQRARKSVCLASHKKLGKGFVSEH